MCACVCAAVQGVFCNDGNRQSLGHQESAGSQRAVAHRRPRLRQIKELGEEKKEKIPPPFKYPDCSFSFLCLAFSSVSSPQPRLSTLMAF